MRLNIAATRATGYPEGFTFLTITQSVLGVGQPATVLAVLSGVATCVAVMAVWWRGLRADPRRYLQLAILPVAATLASLHAGAYELTTWLATVWLLLRYARAVPADRTLVLWLVVAIWCSGNLAVIGESTPLLAVASCAGAAVLGGIISLYFRHRATIHVRSFS